MALNNEFKVKNDLNTLGRILSGGVDIRTIFSPSNTSWTLSANNGTFALSGGDTLQVQGGNGVDVRVATGTDTVRISGIDATTSVKGVASFSSDNFSVTGGAVTIKDGGIVNAELAGSITDDKLSTISTAGKVSNSATTATSSNTANAIVARGASGEFSSGSITATGNLSASGSITGNSIVASNITATNLLSAANTFTRQLSVGNVQVRTAGTSNAFIGDNTTGRDATTGGHNFVFGSNAGCSNTSGASNNFLGNGAGRANTSGSGNNFLGNSAGTSNTTGGNNNFLGNLAGNNNIGGYNNNFFGTNAGFSNTTGGTNNFFGLNAGFSNNTGSSNNFLGYCAGLSNTTGHCNNFFGYRAGFTNEIGSNNTIIGNQADVATSSLSGVIALGTNARATQTDQIVLSTASISIRSLSGNELANGGPNLFIGNSTTGNDNATGHGNFVFGRLAGNALTSGSNNTFIGGGAGDSNTTGGNNNFFGRDAGIFNTTGSCNNFLGYRAGPQNTTGGFNNFLGNEVGGYNSTGSFNNFIGRCAGNTNTVGSNNTIIGNGADVATNALSGVVVLGTGAVATESHQIVLSTANVVFKNTGSTFEIGTPSLTDNLTVFGAVSSTGIVNTNTGFRISNAATSGHVLRGNGTNFVSSTLAASDIASGQALTKTDDTNVTLTLGGSPTTALLAAASLTLGWSGQLGLSRGGTNASTAQGAINNLAGAVTSGQYLRGNGTNVVMSTIQVADVPTLNQNTTGSAATLTTTRTLWGQNFNGSANVTGNLTTVGNISGTGAITIFTGSSNQDITLSTSGTGEVNITNVDIDGGSINGTTIGLSVPASGVFTGVSVTGNVSIDGNLFVSGSATQINTTDLVVQDPIIFLGEGNLADTVDIGFTAAYNHGLTPVRHTGLIRENVTKKWTLFSNLSSEILSAVQIPLTDPSVQIDTLIANIEGTLTGNVSGTALRANQFTTARIISATGDISYSSGSFDGSANVTGTATINNNAVTYAKFQQVAANSVVGNPTGSLANAQAIPASVTGFALLSAANAAAAATTIGLGTTNSVTFGEVIVNNGTKSVISDVYNTTTATNVATLSTFANASYNSAKYTVQIKNTTTSARCALEIIASKNNTTWEGAVYGIVDPANLFTNVDIAAGPTTELVFTLNGVANYAIVAHAQAISD